MSDFDICVLCGKETPYKKEVPIDFRIGYVEGSGQCCFQPLKCEEYKKSRTILIDGRILRENPNDYELGRKIREAYITGNKI